MIDTELKIGNFVKGKGTSSTGRWGLCIAIESGTKGNFRIYKEDSIYDKYDNHPLVWWLEKDNGSYGFEYIDQDELPDNLKDIREKYITEENNKVELEAQKVKNRKELIPIFKKVFPDSGILFDNDGNKFIVAHYPHIVLSDTLDRVHNLYECYVGFKLNTDDNIDLSEILFGRTAFSIEELKYDYIHSHTQGNIKEMNSFCLGDSGNTINKQLHLVKNTINLNDWQILLMMMDSYIRYENSSNPYRRIVNLETVFNCSNDEIVYTESQIKEILNKYLQHKLIPVKYTGHSIEINAPLFQKSLVDYVNGADLTTMDNKPLSKNIVLENKKRQEFFDSFDKLDNIYFNYNGKRLPVTLVGNVLLDDTEVEEPIINRENLKIRDSLYTKIISWMNNNVNLNKYIINEQFKTTH